MGLKPWTDPFSTVTPSILNRPPQTPFRTGRNSSPLVIPAAQGQRFQWFLLAAIAASAYIPPPWAVVVRGTSYGLGMPLRVPLCRQGGRYPCRAGKFPAAKLR